MTVFSSWLSAFVSCAQVPENFTVAYGAGQDELEVGGVFLRIFIAQPGWVLRKPREFLVSLLETLTELLEKNNPNVRDLFVFGGFILLSSLFHLTPMFPSSIFPTLP